MQLEMFINFDGNCREAVDFYATVTDKFGVIWQILHYTRHE